jgi:DNA ligase-1
LSDTKYHPIDDAPYTIDQHIPFSLVAKACQEIEDNSGKDSQTVSKEILANVFRTAIVLKPSELIPLFYFFITRLGPEYEGLETGIGPDILNQAVSKTTGRDMKHIRA